MFGQPGTYAHKKRKKPVLKQKKFSDGNEVVKSNPSKRHRDRLNGELDRLTELLPYPEDERSRLDKLSVLRLSVGYLRVKSHFKATMKGGGGGNSLTFPGVNGQNGSSMDTGGFSEGDLLLQALNGFVMVVTSDGLVFYSSPTIRDYLGFHQSDVLHQSVFELIHTDDRAMFRQQLHFALNPPADSSSGNSLQTCDPVIYSPEQLPPENSSFLERSFVCRFRCLLDNSSGFLTLKFQGRLKYLHSQNVLRDNRAGDKPQLALFTIATPVQPPSIVEIRAKMLIFQTRHKLDFTPTGVDARGKIILGYSETELCMRGSGYQFIHAADMMHCADKHLCMIKTGETGMTVFRLLTKSGSWVWVKSNAKLIYKGGRPEFIIASQRALLNSEGEEFLRQRSMQVPFSFTTGEAVLYNMGPTVDLAQYQFNKRFGDSEMRKDVAPGSLLDCFLSQDETVYTQTVDPPVPVDQVFMDTGALVSISKDSWQEGGVVESPGEPVVVKEEARQSAMAVINTLEQMAQNGNFAEALQNMELDNAELTEWESALKKLTHDGEQPSDIKSELDRVLTNDIFDFIDSVLFKEKGEDCLSSASPCGLNNQQDAFAHFPTTRLCDSPMYQTPSPDCSYSLKNGLYAQQPDAGQQLVEKLSHQGPMIPDSSLPPLQQLQQLQLQDIFSPSIELPELIIPNGPSISNIPNSPNIPNGPNIPNISNGPNIPNVLGTNAPTPFQSCGPVSVSHAGHPGQTPSRQLIQRQPTNHNGPLQNGIKPNNVAPGMMDILPPLIPCNDLSPSTPPNIPIPFATPSPQGSSSFETHMVQQWPQNQQQKLPHTAVVPNGHDPTAVHHSQMAEGQTFPCHTGLWPQGINGLNHNQQGGLACGQASNQSSCMFNQHFSSGQVARPGDNNTLALSGSRATDPSHCFQWNRGDMVAGPTAINQQNGNVLNPNNIQHYLETHRQPQDERLKAELNGIFATTAHDVAMYLME